MRSPLLLLISIILALVSCDGGVSDTSASADTQAINGSYSRVLVVGDYMYRVSSTDIYTFDLSDAAEPRLIDSRDVGFEVESIFHLDGVLFVGSSSALHIFEIVDGIPTRASETAYTEFSADQQPCDPVVSDGEYAYVTLSSTEDLGPCNRAVPINELRIYDVTDIRQPDLEVLYPLSNPKGLAVDGDLLFICDGFAGLRVFDKSDVQALQELQHFDGFETYDAIARDGLLIVVGPQELRQFDYSGEMIVPLGVIRL